MMRIKKNDTVKVISGKDKGKTSSVIAILPKKGKILIKDVAVATKHMKARKQGDTPGIKKEETYICLSKVMPVCPSCKKSCRVGTIELKDGKRARVCGKCKEVM
jgi:large subunit ribosomal protein L24